MPFRTVIFDLDDTLIVDEQMTKEAFALVAKEAIRFGADAQLFHEAIVRLSATLWKASPFYTYCSQLGISDGECLWGCFSTELPEQKSLAAWSEKFRRQVFDQALREQMIENYEAAEELSLLFAKRRRKLVRLMPDALETLTRLQTGFRLGMLTNGDPSLQKEKIEAVGIEGFFDVILISGDHNIGKPDPEIFQILLERLEVAPSEAVMVGNSLARDIVGARNAGMHAVWFEVPGSEEHADVSPDAIIHSLAELPPLVENLRDKAGA